MQSVSEKFEYDVFISYRQKDNEYDGWVTEFVENLSRELNATFKENISIYFDENPTDGLHDHHSVNDSLDKKLKSIILLPIISQTYCDPNSYAWTKEFIAFKESAENDPIGLKVPLRKGNSTSRILPIRIHEIDPEDMEILQTEIGYLRSIDFIYQSAGVNRPLRPKDDDFDNNLNHTNYRNQINKVANAIKEIIYSVKKKNYNKQYEKELTSNDISDSVNGNNDDFGSELLNRGILRVLVTYLLIGTLFWKLLDIGVQIFDWAPWVHRFGTLTLIVLNPIAILLAWFYERSPEGFIRTGSDKSKKNPFTIRQKKPMTGNVFIGSLSALILALFFIYPEALKSEDNLDEDNSIKSIAVLPFVNLSQNEDNEYFSDGITEDIITQISKISNLKVISRSSALRYKNTNKDIIEIGKELDVESILEGTVRFSENRARITANLSNAKNRQQVWAETYDREMKDIFDLQAEVARDIASALHANFSTDHSVENQIPTRSLEAYNLYLKAIYNYAKGDRDGFRLALELSEKAIDLDSEFANAYAVLANAYSVVSYYQYNEIENKDVAREKALAMAEKAIKLNPNLPEAHDAMAYALRTHKWEWEEAEKEAKLAISLNPNFSSAHRRYSLLLAATGRFNEAIKEAQQALTLDPLGAFYNSDMARIHYYAGRSDEAIKMAQKAFEMEPGYRPALGVMASALEQKGLLDSAVVLVSKSKTRTGTDYEGIPENFEIEPKPYKEYWKEVLDRTLVDRETTLIPNMVMAVIYMRNDKYDLAVKALQKAYENKEGSIVYINVEPLFKPIHNNPQYQQIIRSMGLNP